MSRSTPATLTPARAAVESEVPPAVVESFERVLVASREADNVPRDILRRLDLQSYGSTARLRSHLECLNSLVQTLIHELGKSELKSDK